MSRKIVHEECDSCNGTGRKSERKYVDCPNCNGEKVVQGFFGGEKICSECDGSGTVAKDSDNGECSGCKGKGYCVHIITLCDECGEERCSCNDRKPEWNEYDYPG